MNIDVDSAAAIAAQVARERAEKKIDAALTAVTKAVRYVSESHNIPKGVGGHEPDELLGRILFVPGQARELRLALGQTMARHELSAGWPKESAPENPEQTKPKRGSTK